MRVSDVNRLGNDLETDGSDLHSWINIPLGTDGSNYNKLNVDTEGRQSSKQYVWDTVSLSWVAAGAAGGIIGGGGSSAVSYITLMDDTGTYLYVGEAIPNTSSASASWRIKRISNTSVLYADGNTNFDNIWNNRASYSYS